MAARQDDYYEILELDETATAQEIQRAYRRLARRYHPDVAAGPDARARFHEVSSAYEVLRDPARRARYDRTRGVAAPDTRGAQLRVVVVWNFPWPPRISFTFDP
jgi:DnaJ-class molecular chaperone